MLIPELARRALLLALAVVAVAPPALAAKDVPYVPTPEPVVDAMLKLGRVTASDYVIDLGSGDGRIAIAAGRIGARALGVDIDPERIAESRANLARAGLKNVEFRQGDLFDLDLKPATVITMYLLPAVNLRLRPSILALTPGTRIVSHAFDMGDWEPDRREEVEAAGTSFTLYGWTVPARAAGRWSVEQPGRALQLTLTQTNQMLAGTATLAGKPLAVTDGRMDGSTIALTFADGSKLNGAVDGTSMRGPGWRAKRVG